MPHKFVEIANESRQRNDGLRRIARMPVAARIPGEECESRQIDLVDDVCQASGVLVATMQQHDRAVRSRFGVYRRPVPIE